MAQIMPYGKKHGVLKIMVKGIDKQFDMFAEEELEYIGRAKSILFAVINSNLFHQVSNVEKRKEV